MKFWSKVDGGQFALEHLQFEEKEAELSAKVQETKRVLKEEINAKIKEYVRSFYRDLFEF